jgi:hypothetical protein
MLRGCNNPTGANKRTGCEKVENFRIDTGFISWHNCDMRANDKAVVIWSENGCWFQQRTEGVLRSSYLGHIGTPDEVRQWCESKAVDFTTKFHDFAGTAIREKWPNR